MNSKSKRPGDRMLLNKRSRLKKAAGDHEDFSTKQPAARVLRSSTNLKRKFQSATVPQLPSKLTRREPPALRRFQDTDSEDEDEENVFKENSISGPTKRKTNMQGLHREIVNIRCGPTRGSRDVTGLYRLRSDGASSGAFADEASDSDTSEITQPDTEWSDESEEDSDTAPESVFFNHSSDVDEDVDRFAPATSRFHRCTALCPFGCRGNYRPSEIIIYEGVSTLRLMESGMKRVCSDNPVQVELKFSSHCRVGGRGVKKGPQVSHTSKKTRETKGKGTLDPLPQRIAHLLDKLQVDEEEALLHAWNPQDRSFNVRVKDEDPFTIRRQPVAQSTDSARTLQGYSSGLHIFEITWPVHKRGTHAAVGVSTERQTLHSIGYSTLIGQSDQSWGWDLGRLKAYHNSNVKPGHHYPAVIEPGFKLGDTIFLVLDCDAGKLGFLSGGRWLGVAHSGLKDKILYPTVSGVWGNCEITMRYQGGLDLGSVVSLSEMCRTEIRAGCSDFSSLPIPQRLKNFLKSS